VEDAVEQLQLQLRVVQSRLGSDAASVEGHMFKSYEDTYQRVVANCSPEDCKYVMDIPSVFSLVRPEGQNHDVMITEELNYSKAGYASSSHARLSFSFKTKVPGFFGDAGSAKGKYQGLASFNSQEDECSYES
jgi:hypothetical protein